MNTCIHLFLPSLLFSSPSLTNIHIHINNNMGLCFGSLNIPNNNIQTSHNLTVSLHSFMYNNSSNCALLIYHEISLLPVNNSSDCSSGKSQVRDILTSKSHEEDGGTLEKETRLKVFSYEDLKAVTKNFKSDALIGEGGFGKVYKGWLDQRTLTPSKPGSGIIVAIKKLKPDSMQGVQEWQSEINFLGSISHPNLVKLLGYCSDNDEFLLVYEFMPKGSLENHLFRRNINMEPLSWNTRLKIAIDVARGLAFLHSSEKKVIYRDFKASNMLLDGNYNAKISDFGLAKFGPLGGDSHVTTRIMGTYGYAAPEYMATGHLYVKSDVYGFGVVLLEMLTGLQALDTKRPTDQQNLVEWIKPSLSDKRKLQTIVDQRLEGQYSSKEAFLAAQLILKCLESDLKKRPSMKHVLETLEGIEAMKDNMKISVEKSDLNGSLKKTKLRISE